MGERIRHHDWASTPVGRIETWPHSLRTAVSIMLHSKFPTYMLWGQELTSFYNDAYAPVLGSKPDALGRPFREVWAEAWDTVGPIAERAFLGQASYFEDLPIILKRNGYPEQTWWTFSYSPIHDETGGVGGILCIVHDTTAKVLSERRLEFLVRLSDRLRGLNEPIDVIAAAQEMLGQHLGASRVGYGEVEATARYFTTEHNWTDGSVAHRTGTHDLAAFGPEIHGALKRGETLVVNDAAADPRTNSPDHLSAFAYLELRAVITVSLIKRGRMVAALYVHDKEPRLWSSGEIKLIEDVAERTWDAVERLRSEAALRKSEERLQLALTAASVVGTWDWDIQSDLVYADERFASLYGVETEAAAAGAPIADFVSGIHPDDRSRIEEQIQQTLETGETLAAEYRTIDKSGRIHWVFAQGRCYRAAGQPVRFPGISVDITERKKAEEHRELLINELNHRVKNTLATVQSIASQTLRNADNPEAARASMEARLLALSRAHDVLTRENWEGAGLIEIVRGAMAPYRHERENRLHLEGPDVRLTPRMALAIAMALQELATNAVKYGALSNTSGEVQVAWFVKQTGEKRLHLTWSESGGPVVEPPRRRGFGTRLIERSLAQDLNGEVHITFAPSGVICTVDAPIVQA
ncbi:PAS domain-containing sensor histidine kinase [Microvirga mediterraneensis]|uniref:Blue-light-activated histidine kinase n=1 Tax=Microvirga mediterraneensis TaxID=2754695 RepID=A0A838BQD6_9HYPH|nr:HWE histidine kinase domain-containing protein [Microvirga mediterraneensis]MBA1157152.1 PAS domain-containing protein [Microvirga mediterraneensis]